MQNTGPMDRACSLCPTRQAMHLGYARAFAHMGRTGLGCDYALCMDWAWPIATGPSSS